MRYPEYFGEVDDCSICPFCSLNWDDFKPLIDCNGNPDNYLPCTDESLFDLTIDEAVECADGRVEARREYYQRERDREEAIIKKNKERAYKASRTRFENREINAEISVIRTRIRENKSLYRRLKNMQTMFSSLNSITQGGIPERKVENLDMLLKMIKSDEKELDRLMMVRDKMNRERRKQR